MERKDKGIEAKDKNKKKSQISHFKNEIEFYGKQGCVLIIFKGRSHLVWNR